jgi:FkbM family methyltransferase
MKSYSQLNQDVEVLQHYKNTNGYYVEIGASDGINLSNTYLLEKEGWKGICVEPIPSVYEELKKNRPNSYCCNKAVYHTSGLTVNFDICNLYSLLSGISESIDTYKAHIDQNKTSIQVETISLNDLLDKVYAPKFIEYLSIDTEGSEYEILKAFDFTKRKFGIIHVEHNYVEPRRTYIRELLESMGYRFERENQWDDIYLLEITNII